MEDGKKIVAELGGGVKFGVKWIIIALVFGSVCGLVGAAFHHAIDYVVGLRTLYPWLVYLMPAGGIAIVFLYRVSGLGYDPGTNTIIRSVRQQDHVSSLLAPAIFIATVITQLVGGSSGREGAALQIGGSLATGFGKLIKADARQLSLLIMCGMTAVFAALFGTPLTATIFSIEVISVGVFYYAALVPCLCSGLAAFFVAGLLGCHSVSYQIDAVLTVDLFSFGKLVVLALVLAAVSVFFVLSMHGAHHFFQHKFINPYLRVLIGSGILILLTALFGTSYLGAGMEAVDGAVYGDAVLPYAFVLKIIFTAITIGCGFKGGEIVPTFFIGATLGYTVCTLLAIDPHLGAALGVVGLFCCVVNAPIASLILGIEVFGSQNLIPMAVVVVFCYVLSGYFSLYSAQKFVYAKTSPEFINKNAE